MKLFKNYNIPTIIKAIKLMGKRSKVFLTCIILFCAVELGFIILNAYGTKWLITALGEKSYGLFWKSILIIVIKNAMWWVYAPISTYLCDFASKGTIRDVKTNFCEHILNLPMKYHDSTAKGELISAVTNDTACLEVIYDWSFFQVLHSAVGGIGGIAVMAVMDWRFAIIVILLGSISVFTASYFSKKLEKVGTALQDRLAKTSTDAYELVKAAKTIRVLNLYEVKTRNFNEVTKLEADLKLKSGKISSKMNAISAAISSISYIAILFIGALFVYFKLSDWGTIIALIGLKDATDMLFLECGQHMAGMQTNVAGVKRLFKIANTPKEKILREMSYAINKIDNPVVVKDVSFSYDTGAAVLNKFNMNIENNKLTAVVGESGSGKSTLMKLILGLYEPEVGSIIFNGNEKTTLKNIRSKTSYVPQDAMLFRGSIYDNIAFGNENAAKEEIITAAKLAGAHKFICNLENGYDTVLLDDGKSLSGGQKQRIAIARALVKNAEILLLDEITSSLDKETEEQVLETVKNISKTKAVMFITHRKDVIKWADKVVRMNC